MPVAITDLTKNLSGRLSTHINNFINLSKENCPEGIKNTCSNVSTEFFTHFDFSSEVSPQSLVTHDPTISPSSMRLFEENTLYALAFMSWASYVGSQEILVAGPLIAYACLKEPENVVRAALAFMTYAGYTGNLESMVTAMGTLLYLGRLNHFSKMPLALDVMPLQLTQVSPLLTLPSSQEATSLSTSAVSTGSSLLSTIAPSASTSLCSERSSVDEGQAKGKVKQATSATTSKKTNPSLSTPTQATKKAQASTPKLDESHTKQGAKPTQQGFIEKYHVKKAVFAVLFNRSCRIRISPMAVLTRKACSRKI